MKVDFIHIPGTRLHTIDVLRALTMILMIFVNDLWSLKNIPSWLGHVERGVDGMGLADTVFPAFLFIVGLSLPYAIAARRRKGDSELQLIGHVLTRALALLIMGVYLVNGESINSEVMGLPRLLWNSLCCLCFILIWNQYSGSINKYLEYGSKTLGILCLLVLAYFYRGGKTEAIEYFSPHWWGILGLIGWSYLAGGLLTVLAKNNLIILALGWVFFALLSMAAHAGWIPASLHFIPDAIRGGTLAGLTVGGVCATTLFQYYRNKAAVKQFYSVFSLIVVGLYILSIVTRPYWGLAKLGATPAWLFMCSALTLLGFMIIYWMVDVKDMGGYLKMIKPAGTDTLLCYLLPYFAYSLIRLFNIHLPEILLTGGLGLVKSMTFALGCAWVTGLLSENGIRLKL